MLSSKSVAIYLDHNATTPIDPAVADAMDGALREEFGNASSVHAWGQRAKARLDLVAASKVPDSAADIADILLEHRAAIAAHIEAGRDAPFGGKKIRHHGDFHLGQVLVTNNDAVIIDFEGEPSRPVAERRRKAPAARDVAGVLRSLDYAAMSFGQRSQDSNELAPAAAPSLLAWREQTTEGFLSAYQGAMGTSVLWPDRADEANAMLNFFLLEKALYEIEYELSYRPSWVSVPLRGILQILEGSISTARS